MSNLRSERWLTPAGSGRSISDAFRGNRRLRIVAFAIAVVIVQHGLMPDVTLLGVHPDLLLLATAVIAISGGPDRGAIAGFAAGLSTDLFLNTPLGTSALAYAIAGYLAGRVAREADDLPWTIGGFAAACTAVGVTLYVVVGSAVGGLDVSVGRWLQVVVVLAVINALLAPLLTPLFDRAWRSRRGPAW